MASYDDALAKIYGERLTAFYAHYDAAKVASVPTLLAKYKGKEEQLLAAMVKKYGPEPEPEEGGDDGDDSGDEEETDDEDARVAAGKGADGAAAEAKPTDADEDGDESSDDDGADKPPIYCGVCGLPPEYCEYGGDYEKCAVWIKRHCPKLLKKADDGDDGEGKKKGGKRGGGVIKKKVVAEDKQKVVMFKEVRSKKKAVTVVVGLETLGVKLKDAAKTFGKKFAASSSVKETPPGTQEIVIQGDVLYDLPELLAKEFKIPRKKMFEKEKGDKLVRVR